MPYDHVVFSDRIFVASGSGNFDTDHDLSMQFALCPSYNAVCVGGYIHNDTLGPENFGWKKCSGGMLRPKATLRLVLYPQGGVKIWAYNFGWTSPMLEPA